MSEFFTSGLAVDLVLALMAGEAVLLIAIYRLAKRGPAPSDWMANLASGFCLVLGVRAVVGGAPWPWLALALSGSLVAHLLDLKLRWR